MTTFTRNLAADIETNLKSLCGEAAMKRIRVINLDRWVFNFQRSKGYDQGYRSSPRPVVFLPA